MRVGWAKAAGKAIHPFWVHRRTVAEPPGEPWQKGRMIFYRSTSKVNELLQQYDIHEEAAGMCVDDLGVIDKGKLTVAIHTAAITKRGLPHANLAKIEASRSRRQGKGDVQA